MRFVASITTAVKIIRLIVGYRKGVAPETGQRVTIAHSQRIIGTDEIRKILNNPGQFLDEKRRLTLTIANCSLLAAPFLLFHLKRLGFSRSRVVRTGNNLSLSALR
jgi:hypothetical protein